MAIVSASIETERLTTKPAAQRNELVAQLAESIAIAHASAGGDWRGKMKRGRAEACGC